MMCFHSPIDMLWHSHLCFIACSLVYIWHPHLYTFDTLICIHLTTSEVPSGRLTCVS